jgi:hypothetical protein
MVARGGADGFIAAHPCMIKKIMKAGSKSIGLRNDISLPHLVAKGPKERRIL